jgi:hypothetical protein
VSAGSAAQISDSSNAKGIATSRSLLKYWRGPRESFKEWMARRRRRASPQWAVRSRQRRQSLLETLARRVALLLAWTALLVGQRSLRIFSLLAPCPSQIQAQRDPLQYFNRLLRTAHPHPRSRRPSPPHRARPTGCFLSSQLPFEDPYAFAPRKASSPTSHQGNGQVGSLKTSSLTSPASPNIFLP